MENIEKDQRLMGLISWQMAVETISSSRQIFMDFTLLLYCFKTFQLNREILNKSETGATIQCGYQAESAIKATLPGI